MPLIALNITMPENPFRIAKRFVSKLQERVLDDNVHFFAQTMLPERFHPGNETRFKHARRNRVYREQIKRRAGKGQGKFVNLQLSGKAKRQATTLYKVTGKTRKRLRLTLPTYYLKPFVGTFRDPRTGRTKRVTRQPDKAAELQQIDERDKARLQKRADKAARALAPSIIAQAAVAAAKKKQIGSP